MTDNRLVKAAVVVIAGAILVPLAWNYVVIPVVNGGLSIANAIIKMRYNHKIQKGLKDGSIVEIDGKFYKVEVPKEEA